MHNDIEFSDSPVTQGLAFNDLGKITSYVLSFEDFELAISKEGEEYVFRGLKDWTTLRVPVPVMEAISRLDLAGLSTEE